MDPELLAKLSRRLRAVEGDKAEDAAQAAWKPKAKEEPMPLRLQRVWLLNESADAKQPNPEPQRLARNWLQPSFWRPLVGSGLEAEAGCSIDTEAKRVCRRRVQVPAWVSNLEARPTSAPGKMGPWLPWKQTTGTSSASRPSAGIRTWARGSQSGAVPATSKAGRDNWSDVHQKEAQLKSTLQLIETDRAKALQEASNAEAAAAVWKADLEAEAQRLGSLRQSLMDELAIVQAEAAVLRGKSGPGRGQHLDGPSGKLANLMDDIHNLGVHLYSLGTEQSTLQVRVSSLHAELQRQVDDHEMLQVHMLDCQASQEELREALNTEYEPEAEYFYQSDTVPAKQDPSEPLAPDVASFTLGRRWLTEGRVENEQSRSRPAAMPAMTARFSMNDTPNINQELSDGGTEGEDHHSEDGHDLELAYGWGLDIASQGMSVERAMQLARWAASLNHRAADEDGQIFGEHDGARGTPDLDFEVPLAELQDALRVLQAAASRSTAGHDSEGDRRQEDRFHDFDSPVADLQRALTNMRTARAVSDAAKHVEAAAAQSTSKTSSSKQKLRQGSKKGSKNHPRSTVHKTFEGPPLADFDVHVAGLQKVLAMLPLPAAEGGG